MARSPRQPEPHREPPARPSSQSQEPARPELDGYLRALTSDLDYVYRAVRRHGVRAADAEDLAQEVFLIAWRRRADFDGTRPMRPWLAGIAFKVAHQHLRRRPPEVLDAVTHEVAAPAAPELEPDALDARTLVLEALGNLPDRHRSVLVLHELDGLSVDDLSGVLEVPRFTLYTRLRRARAAFSAEVKRLLAIDPRRQAAGAVVMPAGLFAIERNVPPAPPGIHDRVLQRLRAEAALPPAARAHHSPAPSPRPPRLPLLAAGLASVAAVVGTMVVTRRPPPPAPAGGAAPVTVTGAGPPALPSLTRHAPPALRTVAAPALEARPAPAPADAALDRDLTGHWRLDDGPGATTARDQSGGGHHCQLRDLDPQQAWIAGVAGGAVELGFNGWLECPQPALPSRSAVAITVAAWVRRAGNPHMNHVLAMRAMDQQRRNYFFFGFVGDELRVASSGWGGALKAHFSAAPGRWTHVAFTHISDNTTRLYIDGAEVARGKSAPRMFGAVNQPLRVGAGLLGAVRDRTAQRFEGAVDELRVYERALSEEEIRRLARPPETTGTP